MNNTVRFALMAMCALGAAATGAAPIGYSVNSDEPSGDSLHAIDLATGQESLIGEVQSLGTTRTDVEGLAFDASGVLWAMDDESLHLFPVDITTGAVLFAQEASLNGIGALEGNDFGMTFTCTGELYATSVATQSLYRVQLDGTAQLVGSAGSLGANISALAAFGNPVQLYGLGNGLLAEGGPADNRSLYLIDTATGTAGVIGTVGAAVADYFQAGLSFDATGTLWALTDRRIGDQALGSQILTINTQTGQATLRATTSVTGFESLAVAPPAGCDAQQPAPNGPAIDEHVPTLGPMGKLAIIVVLLALGLGALHRGRAV